MIDSQNVEPGNYELKIESFNTLSTAKSSLKTDTISIVITAQEIIPETVIEVEQVPAAFAEEL